MTPDQLKALLRDVLEKDKAATPGPWVLGDENNQHAELSMQHGKINLTASFDRTDRYARGDDYSISRAEMLANVEFCALARNVSPAMAEALLGEIERAESYQLDCNRNMTQRERSEESLAAILAQFTQAPTL